LSSLHIPSISGQGGLIAPINSLTKLQRTFEMTFWSSPRVLCQSVPIRSTLSVEGFVTAWLNLPVLGCQGSTLPKLIAFVLDQPSGFICHSWVAGKNRGKTYKKNRPRFGDRCLPPIGFNLLFKQSSKCWGSFVGTIIRKNLELT